MEGAGEPGLRQLAALGGRSEQPAARAAAAEPAGDADRVLRREQREQRDAAELVDRVQAVGIADDDRAAGREQLAGGAQGAEPRLGLDQVAERVVHHRDVERPGRQGGRLHRPAVQLDAEAVALGYPATDLEPAAVDVDARHRGALEGEEDREGAEAAAEVDEPQAVQRGDAEPGGGDPRHRLAAALGEARVGLQGVPARPALELDPVALAVREHLLAQGRGDRVERAAGIVRR